MTAKVVVDTNVLVYAYDRSAGQKQATSFAVLDELVSTGSGALTTQVLAEFFVVTTSKIPHPLTAAQASERLKNYAFSWEIFQITPMVLLEAARGVREHKFHFWDSQIWATARLYQASLIISEDFSSGSQVEGVRFVNPYEDGFTLERWL